MARQSGTRKNNPQFTLDNGLVLSLQPISNIVIGRVLVEWIDKHPRPVPPIETLSNGDAWRNENDPAYKEQMDLWSLGVNETRVAYTLFMGIQNRPPKDWVNEIGIYTDKPTLAWLYSQFRSDEEMNSLIEAIVGLSEATGTALDEAKKNSA